MNAATRLALFGASLAVLLGGGALAGAAIGPTTEGGSGAHGSEPDTSGAHGGGGGGVLSGLAVTDGRYAMKTDGTFFAAGKAAPFAFRITDERGRTVRDDFQIEHEKELHLIVVRRDTAVFQHLHPQKGGDGTWSVKLELPEPGAYRAYADFTIAGTKRTLATELFVPGDFQPRPLPAPQATARTVDLGGGAAENLDVALAVPGVRAGREAQLAFSVTRDGQAFADLEPYLGAKGHLVALREGDLAYLHVHPTEAGADHAPKSASAPSGAHGNEIDFAATFPSPGRYRLFLQFKTAGEIRTVSYTVEVPR